jgi:hypothetical protein
MAKKDVPSAVPPALFSYDIQGQLLVQEHLRKADAKSRPPASEHERGSNEDRLGNRGSR